MAEFDFNHLMCIKFQFDESLMNLDSTYTLTWVFGKLMHSH